MKPQQTAEALVKTFSEKGLTLATAESCTGGLIAKLVTDIPGSSAVLAGGFVTYTNAAKISLLGIDPALIAAETEVSHACAAAMAEGAKKRLQSSFAVSTTGFAGPGGGNDRDPVGTVYIGIASPAGTQTERFCAPADATREEVRNAAALRALELLLERS